MENRGTSLLNSIYDKGVNRKGIRKGTRNITVLVLFHYVVYSNFSARTTPWIHNRKRKLLCIYRQQSVLISIGNKCGYTKEIQKGTKEITVPVY